MAKLVVCDPRRNALLKSGNKSDKIDARKLADLLRAGLLTPVYHGEGSLRVLRELVRVYLALTQDATRVMSRIKALYRSWAVSCAGERVYSVSYREQWLQQISEASVCRRAEFLYHELDHLVTLRKQARHELLAASRKHPACRALREEAADHLRPKHQP